MSKIAELCLPITPVESTSNQTSPTNRQSTKKTGTKDSNFSAMLSTAVQVEGEEQLKSDGNSSVPPNPLALLLGLAVAQVPIIQDASNASPCPSKSDTVPQTLIPNVTTEASNKQNPYFQKQFINTLSSPVSENALQTETEVQPVNENKQQSVSVAVTVPAMQNAVQLQPQKESEGAGGVVSPISIAPHDIPLSSTKDAGPIEESGTQNQSKGSYVFPVAIHKQQMVTAKADGNENSVDFKVNIVEDQVRPFAPVPVVMDMKKVEKFNAVTVQTAAQATSELEQQQQPSKESVRSFDEILARVDLPGSKEPSFTQVSSTEKSDVPAANSPVDRYNVTGQIVEHVKLVNRSSASEMIIKLKPEHLGELTLKITVDSGVVNASFHSNNNEVRSIIEAALPQLKQDISNVGLKVENVGVYAGLDQFFSNNQQGNAPQPVIKLKTRKSADSYDQVVEEVANLSVNPNDGVDYRI